MTQGGGATFGVMTSVTINTFPEVPITTYTLSFGSAQGSEAYWETVAYLVSKLPHIMDSGVAGYAYALPQYDYEGQAASIWESLFLMPNSSIAKLESIMSFFSEYVNTTWSGQITLIPPTTTQFPTVYAYYQANKNQAPVGENDIITSRLLDGAALSKNVSLIREYVQTSLPTSADSNTDIIPPVVNINLISGPGLWKAVPAGGSDSVNPVWRRAYLEYGMSVSLPSLFLTKQPSPSLGLHSTQLSKPAPKTSSQTLVERLCENGLLIWESMLTK